MNYDFQIFKKLIIYESYYRIQTMNRIVDQVVNLANNRVYILGAGGHAQQVVDVFEALDYTIEGFFDDMMTEPETQFNQYQIIDKIENIEKYLDKTTDIFCAIGDPEIRS